MAAVCVELRMKPADYWDLRADEFNALIDELKARQKQAKAVQGG